MQQYRCTHHHRGTACLVSIWDRLTRLSLAHDRVIQIDPEQMNPGPIDPEQMNPGPFNYKCISRIGPSNTCRACPCDLPRKT
jgi:hypothetical protein